MVGSNIPLLGTMKSFSGVVVVCLNAVSTSDPGYKSVLANQGRKPSWSKPKLMVRSGQGPGA